MGSLKRVLFNEIRPNWNQIKAEDLFFQTYIYYFKKGGEKGQSMIKSVGRSGSTVESQAHGS